MEIVCLPRKVCNVVKTSFYPDNNVVYVQPPRPAINRFRESDKRRVSRSMRIESNTTYTSSYMEPDVSVKRQSVKAWMQPPKAYGKFDMNTVNKMSYKWTRVERPKTCYPQPRLGCGKSPMEKTTVHMASYINPGIVRTVSAKCTNRRPVTAPMESTTIARESYQHPGPPIKSLSVNKLLKNQRPCKLSFKPDYDTINRCSYQKIGDVKKRKSMRENYCKGEISAKIGCETTYNTSYMIPGYFVRIKNWLTLHPPAWILTYCRS